MGIGPTAYVESDVGGWCLRWQDGDLYWVEVDLAASTADEAEAEARLWLEKRKTTWV